MAQLLQAVDAWGEEGPRRRELRILVLVHDSLKFAVKTRRRRAGENHHAMRARRFAESLTDDERLLATLELHDRPYAIWRRLQRTGRSDAKRFDDMLLRIPDVALFARFVELDGSTEGKNDEPVRWFKDELRRRNAG